MRQILQVDIANFLDVSEMMISRAMRIMGRSGEALSEGAALALLTAAELKRLGLAWPAAVGIAGKFDGEILYLARDPNHRAWLVHIERPDQSFWVSCLSATHLDSIFEANPLALTLSLRAPVSRATEHLQELQQMRAA